jgi:hypothetical protein
VNQYVSDSGFKDPVVILLDPYILDHPKASDFIYSSIFSGEYGFMSDYLSLVICLCYYLLISNKDKTISILKLLEWILWKSFFT